MPTGKDIFRSSEMEEERLIAPHLRLHDAICSLGSGMSTGCDAADEGIGYRSKLPARRRNMRERLRGRRERASGCRLLLETAVTAAPAPIVFSVYFLTHSSSTWPWLYVPKRRGSFRGLLALAVGPPQSPSIPSRCLAFAHP
eukprot:scaffold34556_cov129-Isochrysis_galbana.AAC.9